MTDSFGARLRREREQRQISLADIADRTKIVATLFESLERDDVSRWPAGIYRRSFMRAYAEAIGLDAVATVREFCERFPDPSEPGRAQPATETAAGPVAAVVPPAGVAAPATALPALRLTLVDTGLPFTGGRFIADARRRWSAAAWDLGSLLAIGISIFVMVGRFWMPFGIIALCYYVGGILVLGNSPGVCLFAPVSVDGDAGDPPMPQRAPRPRPVEAQPRPAEGGFRPGRIRAMQRGSELRSSIP